MNLCKLLQILYSFQHHKCSFLKKTMGNGTFSVIFSKSPNFTLRRKSALYTVTGVIHDIPLSLQTLNNVNYNWHISTFSNTNIILTQISTNVVLITSITVLFYMDFKKQMFPLFSNSTLVTCVHALQTNREHKIQQRSRISLLCFIITVKFIMLGKNFKLPGQMCRNFSIIWNCIHNPDSERIGTRWLAKLERMCCVHAQMNCQWQQLPGHLSPHWQNLLCIQICKQKQTQSLRFWESTCSSWVQTWHLQAECLVHPFSPHGDWTFLLPRADSKQFKLPWSISNPITHPPSTNWFLSTKWYFSMLELGGACFWMKLFKDNVLNRLEQFHGLLTPLL